MGIRTFMVHAGPDYEHTEMVRSYCSVSWCEEEHETTPTGARRHVQEKPWTTTVNDIIRDDTGEVVAEHAYSISSCAVPGAMYWWDISISDEQLANPACGHFFSGPQLCVVLPDKSPWNIDSKASNCTLRSDLNHRCWVRHGEPPDITVDKDGVTCAAGAGSIMSGSYHGFLRSGQFEP